MTRNNADFHGATFSHSISGGHVDIHAHLNGENVGNLSFRDDTGRIEDIGVEDEHQMKGIGTGMWRHAQMLHSTGQIPVAPQHSDYRTPEGEAFAKSVGGHLPKNTAEWAVEGY